MTTELFNVKSVADLRGCKNVSIYWFVPRRATPLDLPYAEMIKDYHALALPDREDYEREWAKFQLSGRD
jgi:hypothetical protein